MKMETDKEDRMSYALDRALQQKPNGRKKLTNNEMLHQIFTRFDKDVDFRLNDEEFIDYLKALDSNWKEHIVDIAWEVRSNRMYSIFLYCPSEMRFPRQCFLLPASVTECTRINICVQTTLLCVCV